jgi:DNA-binding transcriptional MerR regulator
MNTLQIFEPNPNIVYTIDATARLAAVPRHSILVYYKHGLLKPIIDEGGCLYFDDESIRMLRRIEFLRIARGVNIAGIKMTLDLMKEVERLQAEVRFLRR